MGNHASRRLASRSARAFGVQKKLGWLLLICCCCAAIGCLSTSWMTVRINRWLCDTHRMPAMQLSISGELQRISEQDIRNVLQRIIPRQCVITQDVKLIQRELERLPWVAEAKVRKQWPNQLKVHLLEHQVVARWNDQQLLDSKGRCFLAPLDRQTEQQLPQFYGPQGYEQRMLASWLAMGRQVLPYGFKITSVVVNQRQAWQMVLNKQIRLLLGRGEHTACLQRFLVLYPLLGQQQAALIRTVDLRYVHGAAISRVASSTQPSSRNRQRI